MVNQQESQDLKPDHLILGSKFLVTTLLHCLAVRLVGEGREAGGTEGGKECGVKLHPIPKGEQGKGGLGHRQGHPWAFP